MYPPNTLRHRARMSNPAVPSLLKGQPVICFPPKHSLSTLPKASQAQTACSGGNKKFSSLRQTPLFLFSLTAGFLFLNVSWRGKGKEEEGRKENHGISPPAQQCRLCETEGSCSLCAGISLAILLKLWGVFLSAAPTLPPFLPKLLVVTE